MNISLLVDGVLKNADIETMDEFKAITEALFLQKAMDKNYQNQSHTARQLGMNRGTFRELLKTYGMLT